MAQCTAPVQGHRTASGQANCPACGGRSFGYYSTYTNRSTNYGYSSRRSGDSTSVSSRSSQPRWSAASSSATYSPSEVRALTPVREAIEARGIVPDRYDLFLCHAWDDRRETARNLFDALEAALAETVNGLYKAELIHAQGPWTSVGEVELATLRWVHWWNTKRLHEALDYATPQEIETEYYLSQPVTTGA